MPIRAFQVGDYVHAIKRGGRGMPIVEDKHDKYRTLQLWRYFNDTASHKHWKRDVEAAGAVGGYMPWPDNWEKQEPLVKIQAYCLMPNHFHLLLKEIVSGGVGKFIERVSKSMSEHYNRRHEDKSKGGSIFDGTYESRVVDSDQYLKYLILYIVIKNPIELHPEGLQVALNNFDEAFSWAKDHPFANLNDFLDDQSDTMVADPENLVKQYFENEEELRLLAKSCIQDHIFSREIDGLLLEDY